MKVPKCENQVSMAECSLHQQQGYTCSLPLCLCVNWDFRMDETSGLELILGVVRPQLPLPGCCSGTSAGLHCSQGSSQLRFPFADNQRYCSGVALPVVSRLKFSRVLQIAGKLVLLLQPPEGVRDHCQFTIFSCLPSPALALGKTLGLLVHMCLWHVQGAAGPLSLS